MRNKNTRDAWLIGRAWQLAPLVCVLLALGCAVGDIEGDEPDECSDGADNDRDGLFDCGDPDCAGSAACAGDDDDFDWSDDDDTTPPPDDDDTTPPPDDDDTTPPPDDDDTTPPADDDDATPPADDDDTTPPSDDDDTEPPVDMDGDGHSPPEDCDDSDPNVHPLAAEVCNGLDDNCDGTPAADEVDADGDGWMVCESDCDDTDGTVNPDGVEVCGNGLDDDCDAATPDLIDMDGDGLPCGIDCDDSDPGVPDCSSLDMTVQGMEMVAIPAGSFEMGCTASQWSCLGGELPVHEVTLNHSLWLGATEVTQGQWQGLLGNNPSYWGPDGGGPSCGGNCPVERVDWYESLALANALSTAEGLAPCYSLTGCTGTVGDGCGTDFSCNSYTYECSGVSVNAATVYDCEGYRLPTEAEWEYAARAGSDLAFAGSDTLDDVAWSGGNSGSMTHAVGTKDPNGWGLYDLSGNVEEWTWDWNSAFYYSISPASDPAGPSTGTCRVKRGGGYSGVSDDRFRVARRGCNPGDSRFSVLGLRLARTVP